MTVLSDFMCSQAEIRAGAEKKGAQKDLQYQSKDNMHIYLNNINLYKI